MLGRLPEARRLTFQAELAALCEARWQELRGPQPDTPVARALWQITPPLADLYLDLYAAGDERLDEALRGQKVAQGLALLVLADIERGNEAGAHITDEPMMALETAPPSSPWLERIAALLRGTLPVPLLHRHDSRPPLFKALAVMAADIKRFDLPAVLQVIRLLTAPSSTEDEALEKVRADVLQAGIRFLGIDDDHVQLEQHGHEHKPVRTRQLAEMLLDIRQMCLR